MLYTKKFRLAVTFLAFGSLLTLEACRDSLQPVEPTSSTGRLAANFDFYALTDNNQLLKLNTQNSGASTATTNVTGLPNGERLLAIDFRPATGQLYGVSTASRLYAINLNSGAATALGAGSFSPAITGDEVAFDFNPTVDRIRLVTNQGQNLRLNPETGTVAAIDGNINGAAGATVTGAAYTNNRAGVTTTTLYDIDPITDKLYRQNPPNDGRLEEVGSLGVDIAGVGSFDIGPDGSAIAILTSGLTRGLYEINLSTGRAERLGDVPNISISGLAIPTEPVAYAVTFGNNLLIFNPMAPNPISKAITGLQPGEDVYGIDFRPRNGQLYAVTSNSRLYTINTSNGAATPVGGPFAATMIGDYGFDFNPTVDRIRLISNTGQNLRLNPDNGTIAATDGMLTGSIGGATAAAYTNNFAGATTTTLYDLGNSFGQLFIQNPPNNGTLVPVGGSSGLLGIQFEGANGFDIGGTSNVAYALLRSNGTTRLYTVNLTGASVTAGAALPGNPIVRGFAVGLGF